MLQEDIAALEFRDMCRLQSVRASVCTRAEDNMPRIAYVTPMWLWYYLYTVGVGVFVMGYTLNGGHDVASGTMALSLTICAVGLSVCEAARAGAMWGVARRYSMAHRISTHRQPSEPADAPPLIRVACAMLLIPAVVLLVVRPYRAGGGGIESLTLGVALPALAPPLLCVARYSLAPHLAHPHPLAQTLAHALRRHRIMSANMRPDAVTAFAIPFVMALSLCYLSVYTPMRAAWMEVSAATPKVTPLAPLFY